MRPNFDFEFDAYTNLDAYVELLNSIAESSPDPTVARQQRILIWDRIMDLVERGVSTGSKMLDRMLLQGRNTVETSENVYYLPYVPTPEQHFLRQDPGEAGMIFRPNLMVHISDEEFSIDVLDGLVELGRNVLAGRAVLRDHPLNTSQDYFNASTYYLTMAVLNLGNIRRIPGFANRKRFPSRIRDNVLEMRKRLVLPHLIVNNPGHIITLCESFDFTVHSDLCILYNVIGIQVRTAKRLHSPPISILVKSQCGLVEVMYHWDEDKKKESHVDEFWMIHAVLARCIFGPKTHDIDEGTRQRTEHRYNGEPIHRFAFTAENRHNLHGCKDIVTPEDQLDNIFCESNHVICRFHYWRFYTFCEQAV